MKGFFFKPAREQRIILRLAILVLLAAALIAAGLGQEKKAHDPSATARETGPPAAGERQRRHAESPAEGEGAQAPQGGEQVTVTRIVDGDTIAVAFPDGRVEKVRYIGIDTPERGRPFAAQATACNASLVAGRRVRMERDVRDRDRYGRLLRYVYVDDLMVNAELVARGYASAVTYPPDVRFAEYFVALEARAREGNLGLWALPDAASPPSP